MENDVTICKSLIYERIVQVTKGWSTQGWKRKPMKMCENVQRYSMRRRAKKNQAEFNFILSTKSSDNRKTNRKKTWYCFLIFIKINFNLAFQKSLPAFTIRAFCCNDTCTEKSNLYKYLQLLHKGQLLLCWMWTVTVCMNTRCLSGKFVILPLSNNLQMGLQMGHKTCGLQSDNSLGNTEG